MQQQQIDFGKPQLGQALLGGSLEIVRREMGGPDFGCHEHIVALDPGSAQALADLAFILIDLRGVDVAIAEPERLLDQARAGSPAQLPGAEPDRGDFCAIGFDELHSRVLEPTEPHYVLWAMALPTWPRGGLRSDRRRFRSQCGKHRLRRMSDHGEKRTRRSARHAFALLPVADGLDGHAEPCGEFELGQARAAAQVANRRRRCASRSARPRGLAGASGNSRPSRNSTIRPSAFSRKRCMFDSRRDGRRCALRFD